MINAKDEVRSWDTYDISRGYPWVLCIARAAEGERRVISFDDKDVRDMIQQFGESNKADTIKHLDNTYKGFDKKLQESRRVDDKTMSRLSAYAKKLMNI